MKNFKQKTKKERFRILYEYREKLMRFPNMYKPHSATKATADYYHVTIGTVYNAVKEVRSSLCTQD